MNSTNTETDKTETDKIKANKAIDKCSFNDRGYKMPYSNRTTALLFNAKKLIYAVKDFEENQKGRYVDLCINDIHLLMDHQDNKCYQCKIILYYLPRVDKVIRGGLFEKGNIFLSCRECFFYRNKYRKHSISYDALKSFDKISTFDPSVLVKQEIVNFDYSNYNKVPSLAILKQARIDHKKEIWGKGLLSIDNPLNLKCNEITLLFDARVKDDLLYCKLCEQIVTDIKLCKIDRSIVMSRDNAMFACDECIRHQSSMIKELKTVSTQSIEPIIDQHIKLNDSDVKSLLLYQKHLCSICFIDLKKKKNKSGINMFVIEFIPYLSSRSINQHICCSTCYNALIIKNREFAIKGTRGAYNEKILLVSLAKQFAPLYRKYAINEVGNEEARALGLIRKHTISETIYDNGEKTIDSIICGRCYSFISTDFIHKDNLYNIIYVDIKSNYKYVLICQYCKMNKSKQYYGKSVKIDYIKKVNNMLTQ